MAKLYHDSGGAETVFEEQEGGHGRDRLLLNKGRWSPGLAVFVLLIVVIYPLGLLVWHSDTQEVERHAQQFMIQSRLGFWLSGLLLIDRLAGLRRRVKSPQNGQ